MNPCLTRRLLLSLATAVVTAGCASTAASMTIAEAAANTPQLSTLSKLLADAGLTDTLRGDGPYTVFAPTDEAFKTVPAATMAQLASNKELLRAVLGYHVLPAKVASANLVTGPAKTVQGAELALSRSGDFVTVEDAVVTQADIAASNGVVHLIDRVLMPPQPRR